MNAIIGILALMSSFVLSSSNPLAKYQWRNRILIVSSNTNESLLQDQLKTFRAYEDELLDRDLIVVRLVGYEGRIDDVSLSLSDVQTIRKIFDIPTDQFTVALIGKDGSLKLKNKELTSPPSIFQLIDRMPMRMSEMKRKGN